MSLYKSTKTYLFLIFLFLNSGAYAGITSNEEEVQTAPILKLPVEVQTQFLDFLDGKDFVRSSLVCPLWGSIAYGIGQHKTLDLSKRIFTKGEWKSIIKVPVGALILQHCQLNWEMVKIFAESESILSLDLSSNPLGDEGLHFSFPSVTSLNLSNTGIGDEGLRQFMSGDFPKLQFLDLSNNKISPEGQFLFSKSALAPQVEVNWEGNNSEGDDKMCLSDPMLLPLPCMTFGNNGLGGVVGIMSTFLSPSYCSIQ